MVQGDVLMELQKVKPAKKGSWFIGQAVQADGEMMVATPLDPCFLLLPMLQKAERYQPLDQIEGMEGMQPVLQLSGLSAWLESICDVKDLGDGDVYMRINHEKVVGWLKAKVKRTAEKLAQMEQRRAATDLAAPGGDGFISGFKPSTAKENEARAAEQAGAVAEPTNAHKEAAVELVCEYLEDEMASKLRERVHGVGSAGDKADVGNTMAGQKRGRADEDSSSSAGPSVPPPAKAPVNKWAQKNDADEMAALAFGSNNKKLKGPDSSNVKKGTQTNANKQLAKTNTKGMKSMASFFGAAKPKK